MRRTTSTLSVHANRVLQKPFSSTSLEIERKFVCNDTILKNCLQYCQSIRETIFIDSYYDTQLNHITCNDMWLRERNDCLELKWPKVGEGLQVDTQFYLESTNLQTIANILANKLDLSVVFNENTKDRTVERSLSNAGITRFGSIQTRRERRKLFVPIKQSDSTATKIQPVNMDLDYVTFLTADSDVKSHTNKPHDYVIGEIELMLPGDKNTESQLKAAQQVMNEVCSLLEIKQDVIVRGKVLEFIHQFRPQHYQRLRDCGQLASKGL